MYKNIIILKVTEYYLNLIVQKDYNNMFKVYNNDIINILFQNIYQNYIKIQQKGRENQ